MRIFKVDTHFQVVGRADEPNETIVGFARKQVVECLIFA